MWTLITICEILMNHMHYHTSFEAYSWIFKLLFSGNLENLNKSIFESILSDKYDESIANHSDVFSPDELIDELISRRNDKTRAATFKLVYTRMENYYDVKWDKMIRRYKRETGRINVLKKELLYWNRGLVERFRISIHDLLEIN